LRILPYIRLKNKTNKETVDFNHQEGHQTMNKRTSKKYFSNFNI